MDIEMITTKRVNSLAVARAADNEVVRRLVDDYRDRREAGDPQPLFNVEFVRALGQEVATTATDAESFAGLCWILEGLNELVRCLVARADGIPPAVHGHGHAQALGVDDAGGAR